MCDHKVRLNQYHGIFSCSKCKEVVYDFSKQVNVDKKEKNIARDLDKD